MMMLTGTRTQRITKFLSASLWIRIGSQVHAGQIPLPEGATLETDPETVVLTVADVERSVDTADLEAQAAQSASASAASEAAAES